MKVKINSVEKPDFKPLNEDELSLRVHSDDIAIQDEVLEMLKLKDTDLLKKYEGRLDLIFGLRLEIDTAINAMTNSKEKLLIMRERLTETARHMLNSENK